MLMTWDTKKAAVQCAAVGIVVFSGVIVLHIVRIHLFLGIAILYDEKPTPGSFYVLSKYFFTGFFRN
ncbi:MAG: hypothetical protein DDT29_00095 [Dehalococcoidia bacterium]|nr:hypothetical protein [Bacillota bacterium]